MNHFWHLHLFEKCLTCSLRLLCPCPPCRLQQPLQVPTGLSEEGRSVTHLQSDVRGVWIQCTGAALWRSSSAAKTSRLYAAADGQDREVQGGPVGQGGWTGWARWVDWLGKVGGLVGQGGWTGWARWLGKVGGLVGQGGWTGWARWLGKVGGLVGQGGWARWVDWVGWLGKVGGLVGQGGWAGCWFLCSFQSEYWQCSLCPKMLAMVWLLDLASSWLMLLYWYLNILPCCGMLTMGMLPSCCIFDANTFTIQYVNHHHLLQLWPSQLWSWKFWFCACVYAVEIFCAFGFLQNDILLVLPLVFSYMKPTAKSADASRWRLLTSQSSSLFVSYWKLEVCLASRKGKRPVLWRLVPNLHLGLFF